MTLFLCFFSLGHAKPPSLTPRDTRIKVEEILRAHVSHQSLSPEIIKRSLQNYLDEVDPGKTYFIQIEIDKWTDPTEELLNQTLTEIRQENFSAYTQIHTSLLQAIERRERLEIEIASLTPPSDVQSTEFKDLKWATSEEQLKDRLLRIKALQLSSAEKLNQETKDQFIQRLKKRRLNREEELKASSTTERNQLILSYTLKALSSSLDSQTAYFTPAEANQFMIQVQQRLFGIGAQLRDDLNGLTIVRLLEGGPALVGNKLKLSDKIIAVDQEPIMGMEITEAVELIRGQQGTPVTLTVLREIGEESSKKEEKLEIDIIRGEVVLKESRLESSYIPFGDGVVGIFHLFSFYQDNKSSSAADLTKEINALKASNNVKGIILDLRNNAGGLLEQAVAVTGLFIEKGVVVSVKDNTGDTKKLRNVENKKLWNGPLIVLTNRTSASASEIVAQTLQDYGRAIIVGDDHTYGKGTFQTFTLESAHYGKVNPKGEYKVTRGRYYTVSGKSPQLVGVSADIEVPGIFSQMEIGEKFSKFPLETDNISSSFEDDLSDVPSIHRNQVMQLYKFNLQQILTTYKPYLENLKKNSGMRIEASKNYQNFLKEVAKKDYYNDQAEEFGINDLQLEETENIMKDLIFMTEKSAA
ncbi:MAG: S41 family peptidase [Chlamydiae bacterium]|nr:S41 family peptidase [Chlamydiota bacterium]